MNFFKNIFTKVDGLLIGPAFLLVCFGLAALYSITLNETNPDFFRFYKQLLFVLVGFALLFLMRYVDYRILKSYDIWFLVGGALLLISVILFGEPIRGTKGWFVWGPVSWQPVEIVKIFFIIWLSSYISKHYHGFLSLKTFLITGSATAFFILLVLLQPDLGSAMLFFGVWSASLIVLKTRKAYIAGLIALLVVGSVLGWMFFLKDYQKDRLTTFLNPASDPLNSGYNVTQSMIAVGSGNFFGRGLGLGPQSQLRFLPERETDFIFAVIAEELGLLGASLILFLFGVLLYRVAKISMEGKNLYATLLPMYMAALIFLQLLVNIGMNVGLMPVTGIPLPFLSAGGSSLVSMLLAIGILQNISRSRQKPTI